MWSCSENGRKKTTEKGSGLAAIEQKKNGTTKTLLHIIY